MSDALLSPAVGGAMWVATGALGARSLAVLRRGADDRRVPLMGVMGAFVFAAQMVNFSIPGTGSSGHLAGGVLLAILLGPHAAFLVLSSVLTIQALFFADGGLLALGCNVFNMAFFSAFVAYPLVYRPLGGRAPSRARVLAGAVAASVVALGLGAGAVVLETAASGISSLPPGPFLGLMVPIHLGIGVVEGLVTGVVVLALWRARPELLDARSEARPLRPVLVSLGIVALLVAGLLAWFASPRPDGLTWSMERAGHEQGPAPAPGPLHAWLDRLQRRTAVLPDYGLPGAQEAPERWPAVRGDTTLSGLVGAGLTLGLAGLLSAAIARARRR